jgi:UDP-GlcNAc3NAcA epimerase
MVCAEKNSRLILTDSGGVQKEAYFHGVLCVTMRTETEWVELVESGWNLVAGIEGSEIVKSVETMLSKDIGGLARENFYGDGKAGEKIVAEIKAWGKNHGR